MYLCFGLQNPEEIIQNERSIKYKLIELQNMAIYWDTDVTLVGDLPSRDLEVRTTACRAHLMLVLFTCSKGWNTVNLNILMQTWIKYCSQYIIV